MNILSIEAWRDGGAWPWNAWWKAGQVSLAITQVSPVMSDTPTIRDTRSS